MPAVVDLQPRHVRPGIGVFHLCGRCRRQRTDGANTRHIPSVTYFYRDFFTFTICWRDNMSARKQLPRRDEKSRADDSAFGCYLRCARPQEVVHRVRLRLQLIPLRRTTRSSRRRWSGIPGKCHL
ncbi:protein of unknown function [Streptomyces sp. KY75]|nr:protein of unknown function [Streptomyces sp. KY75]CAD5990095.1 protein of unknown function [Streptomyces sp. KY70]